ncbi:MAG: PQQ-binding-like beta-propeller repeat protein [Verrucomicrobiae bacterium]|nr:PQQ-binding-like beta-propeller repeat protein [Verrucomicrobiae bacterium]MCP5539825.1 PQQ-binding-like beta-propeller repeat protein [Akkermansiaceae bacterium]
MSAVPKPLQPWKARAFAGSAAFWFPGLLCLWGFPPAARGDDWPQFRGPRRDGAWAETGVLDSFPTGGPPARWRQEVGPGWASPVVSDGRVFVADAKLEKPRSSEQLRAFDEATGKPLWTYAYEAPYPDWALVPGQGGGPSATPIAEENRVTMLGANGEVHCLDTATGRLIWERNLGKEFEVWAMGCRASPLIDGDRLVLFVGAKPGACVMALDKRTGADVWRALDEKILNSSPVVVEAGGRRQLIVWTAESVTALDPGTGAVLWRMPMTTSNNDGVSTPVMAENRLLIAGLMLEFRGGATIPEVLWPGADVAAPKRILSHTSTALFRGDHVYSARMRGELACLDAATGREIWSTDRVTGLKTGASLHLTPAGDGVFLFTDEGNLIRARLTPDGYEERGRHRVLEPTSPFGGTAMAWTPPAYANGHGFFRSDAEIVRVRLSHPTGSGPRPNPVE